MIDPVLDPAGLPLQELLLLVLVPVQGTSRHFETEVRLAPSAEEPVLNRAEMDHRANRHPP